MLNQLSTRLRAALFFALLIGSQACVIAGLLSIRP